MREVTEIEIVGDRMIVHEQSEIALGVARMIPKWLHEKGYTKLLYTSQGFGYAKDKDGLWHYVDARNEHEEAYSDPSKTIPDLFFQDISVSSDEWSPRVRKVPVQRRDTDL